MLSILVAHSYFLEFDSKQRERAKPYPPLATLHAASLLRAAGHDVAVFDAMLASGVSEFQAQLARHRPQLVLFYEDSFNFLSKMCLGRMREACQRMIEDARAADARVVVVGSDASDAPDAYLSVGAEVVLLGEGLSGLLTLAERLARDAALPLADWVGGVSGLLTRAGAPVRDLPGARPPAVGEGAGEPAWDLIDLERYRRVWRQAHGYFSLNMAASRGCSFRCNWCAKPIWGNQYLQRGATAVAAEMLALKHRFAPDHIWFADDIFGFRADWVREFAAALVRDGGGLPFTIQTRADLITPAMADALRAAGCREAWLGAESGSQRILDAMNKGTRVADILAARALLGAAGIRVGFFIQLGYLGEELPDLLATRELLASARPDDVGVSVSYPLPGTRFYEQVRRQLGSKTHWSESKDLEMMFHGTYTSAFYRAVRDLIHAQVELLRPHATAGDAALADLSTRWEVLLAAETGHRSVPACIAATA